MASFSYSGISDSTLKTFILLHYYDECLELALTPCFTSYYRRCCQRIRPQIYPPIKSSPRQRCLVLSSHLASPPFPPPTALECKKTAGLVANKELWEKVGLQITFSHSSLFALSCSESKERCLHMHVQSELQHQFQSQAQSMAFLQLAGYICLLAGSLGSPLYNKLEEIYWFLDSGALPTSVYSCLFLRVINIWSLMCFLNELYDFCICPHSYSCSLPPCEGFC
jgi:hypothetical protein